MITYVLVKVAMHLWSNICATEINAPTVICGNIRYLVASFGSAASWILTSCVHFNNVTFGSWTWRGRIFLFLFINGVFGITKFLVAPVSTIASCEYGGDWTGCCKISLVFILGCVLTNISAPPCHSIPRVLPSWGLSSAVVLLLPMAG